ATRSLLLGNAFFPNAIAPAFISALRLAFYIGAILSAIAAVTSALRGSPKPVSKAVEPQKTIAVPQVRAKELEDPQGRNVTMDKGA
ncbi:MAG: hypothetical protein OK457_08895, partial [Thaumarchaeota archaeon]|nr:hypothetical protein [Nitrososphaerota archaeon]